MKQVNTGTVNTKKTESLVSQLGPSKAESSSTHEIHQSKIYRSQHVPEGRRVVPSEKKTVPTTTTNTSHSLPSLVSEIESGRAVNTVVPGVLTSATITTSVVAVPKLSKQPSGILSTHSSHCHTSKSFPTNSKFVWVKTQNVEGVELHKSSRSVSTPANKTLKDFSSLKSGAESTVAYTLCKKAPAKKPPRRLTQVSVSPKTSKYKWVSSTDAQPKVSRKSISPKVLPPPQKALEAGDTPKKVKAALASAAKNRKEVSTPSRSSRYSWKAATAGGAAVRRRSSFHWTAEKRSKGARGGFSSGTLRTSIPLPSSSPGAFKLRSRMKIIRRSTNRSVNVVLEKRPETTVKAK